MVAVASSTTPGATVAANTEEGSPALPSYTSVSVRRHGIRAAAGATDPAGTRRSLTTSPAGSAIPDVSSSSCRTTGTARTTVDCRTTGRHSTGTAGAAPRNARSQGRVRRTAGTARATRTIDAISTCAAKPAVTTGRVSRRPGGRRAAAIAAATTCPRRAGAPGATRTTERVLLDRRRSTTTTTRTAGAVHRSPASPTASAGGRAGLTGGRRVPRYSRPAGTTGTTCAGTTSGAAASAGAAERTA